MKADHPFIKEQMHGYFTSCRIISQDTSNFQLIHDIVYKLQNTRIPCYKYANTWDWHKCDESLVSISQDGKRLVIQHKREIKDPMHILEPDPNEVEKLQRLHKEK